MGKLDVLEERVANHIKFFWVVVSFGFLWLAALTGLMIHTNMAVNGIAIARADAPAQIVAAILSKPNSSRIEAQANLSAVSAVLQSSKMGSKKPTWDALKSVSEKLSQNELMYPDLPQVWETTGVFISYKSEALLPPNSKTEQVASGKQCRSGGMPGPITYRDCEIALEDAAHQFRDIYVNGQHVPMVFINCIVHYHGGDLPDTRVLFYGSIFRFEIPVVPRQNAIQAMRELADASTFNGVAIGG